MFYGRVLAHPSVMFRDDVVRAAGGYDPNVEVAQDLDLWSRLVGKTRFASLPQRLVRYRSHTGAVSVRRAQTQRGVVLAVRTRLASKDRKSVVEGKSVSVLVDLGGRSIFTQKNKRRYT